MERQKLNNIIKYFVIFLAIYLCTMTGALFPFPEGNYIHIGDVAVVIVSIFCPFKVAAITSVAGCAFADLTLGSYRYIIATVIVKFCVVFATKIFIKMSDDKLVQDMLVCLTGLVTVCGYYIADVVLNFIDKKGFIESLTASAFSVIYNLSQALVTAVILIIVCPIVRGFLDKAKQKKKAEDSNDNT